MRVRAERQWNSAPRGSDEWCGGDQPVKVPDFTVAQSPPLTV
ncbi:hypothetical protein SUDANB56_04729 [Streptomyces sp. enrichment culture]